MRIAFVPIRILLRPVDAFKKTMNSQYLRQPREVSIETLALCNAACSFCPYPTLERQRSKLSDTDLLHLIAQMKSWREPFTISPFKVNEPFLDSRLLTFCRWINEDLPLASLRIFTNGSRFTNDNSTEVLALKNLTHMWISLNETDETRYKALMGLNLNHVASKIDIFFTAWLRAIRHRVIVSRVCEVDAGTEIVRRREFEHYVWNRWPGFVPFHIKRDAWIDYTQANTSVVPTRPCARWEELSITATGDAALCCMDGTARYGKEIKLGNIRTHSLQEIYNHPWLLAKRLGSVGRKDSEPCNRCTY